MSLAVISSFNTNWAVVALLTGFAASDVLSTLLNPIIAFVMPATVPVNVGFASGAFRFNCVVVADETGLAASDVLSTLVNPTIAFVIPATVPVNVGFASGAFNPIWALTVVA